MIRRIATLAAVLLMTGCAWVGRDGFETDVPYVGDGHVFTQLEIFTLINTHKTMGDHVMSWVTGKDCSTPRMQRDSGYYCVDRPGVPPPPPQVYCYSSLASPSCYAQPYTEGNDRLLGFVAASTPRR